MPGYWEMLARAPENRAGENFTQAFIAAQNAAAAARAQKLQEDQYQRKVQAEEQAKEEQARINEAQAVAYAARVAEANPEQYATARAGLIQRSPSLANALPEQLPVNPAHRAQLLSDWKAVGQQAEAPVMSKELADYIQSTPDYVPQDTRAWTPEQREGYGNFLGNQKSKAAGKDVALELSDKFHQQQTYKDTQGMAAQLNRMMNAGDSPPGDLAYIYGYAKIMDPGARVTDSDYQNAANLGSWPTRLQGLVKSIFEGNRLTPQQRTQFMAEAKKQFTGQLKVYEKVADDWREKARKRGIDPRDVVYDFGFRNYVGGRASSSVDTGGSSKAVPGTKSMSDSDLESIANGGR